MAIINGTNGDDILLGTALADTIKGFAGNDTIFGGAGNDWIEGGTGNDILFGEDDDDTLLGGTGNDILRGGTGNDNLQGGSQSDTLYGEDGDDVMDGGSDVDTLWGGDGNDTMYGGSGGASDTLHGEDGDDTMDGGSGNDSLYGGAGADTMEGGSGNDYMEGDAGGGPILIGPNLVANGSFEAPDIVDHGGTWQVYPGGIAGWTNTIGAGPELQDTALGIIAADEGAQYLELDSTGNSGISQAIATGGTGNFQLSFAYSPREGVSAASNPVEVWWNGALLDTLTGAVEGWTTHTYNVQGAGATTTLEFRAAGTEDSLGGFIDDVQVYAVEGSGDVMNGGSGNDVMLGGAGDDTMTGGSGVDDMSGGDGDDSITGGSGSDTLDGGDGDDTIAGNSGDDDITGGLGADTLTGGDDADTYHYGSITESTTTETDLITDFVIGDDVIDVTGLGYTGIVPAAGGALTNLAWSWVGGQTIIDTQDGSDFRIVLDGEHALTGGDFLF